jgi:hypothetical protein
MNGDMGGKQVVRWREAAKLACMGVRTLQRYAAMGKFVVHRPTARTTLVNVASLMAWVMGGAA